MIGLRLTQVSKRFTAPGGGTVIALEDLTLEIQGGEFIVIVGPNGSGKSTLLNLIAGRVRADVGTLTAIIGEKQRDWTHTRPNSRARYIARIHQNPVTGTAEDLTVIENLRLAALSQIPIPFLTAVPASRRAEIISRLAPIALSAKADSFVSELSYGQRQLLALEMAAVRSARMLLLDEPTASLDRDNTALCMRRAVELQTQLPSTLLFVTHDMAIAAQFGNRLLVMRAGRVHADVRGAEKAALGPEDVFRLCGFNLPAVISPTAP